MNKITACLPLNDNNGNSVIDAVNTVTDTFSAIAQQLTGLPGNGLWKNDAGVLFRDPVLVLTAVLPETADIHTARSLAEAALLRYKAEASQESVVMAINDEGTPGTVDELLAAHGGCTQLTMDEEGNEIDRAFSFNNPIFL